LRKEAEEIVNEHANPTNPDMGKAAFQETDVSKWKQLERMFAAAESHFGSVDIVVPGAGIYEPVGLNCFSG
jgi:3-hydroxybutyrate dehydrogenase